jgi:hypothetical protein
MPICDPKLKTPPTFEALLGGLSESMVVVTPKLGFSENEDHPLGKEVPEAPGVVLKSCR